MSSRQRARLFREVNDRIYDLLSSADADLPGEFLCECGEDCERRVVLLPAAFAAMRRTGQDIMSGECRHSRFRERELLESLPGSVAVTG